MVYKAGRIMQTHVSKEHLIPRLWAPWARGRYLDQLAIINFLLVQARGCHFLFKLGRSSTHSMSCVI